MDIKMNELLLVLQVSKEIMRSSPETFEKVEKVIAKDLFDMCAESCLTLTQLVQTLKVSEEEIARLFKIARD